MKVLITAPHSHIGCKLVAELLAPEFSVRVIARDPTRLPQQIQESVEVIRGSIDDFAALREALDGVEALFWYVPLESLQAANIREYYGCFAWTACQAIRDAKTSRVVSISLAGNTLGQSAGPISATRAMEEILNQSGAAVRHLRCGWLMENFLQQAERICGQGIFSYPISDRIALPMVAARDIAETALQRLVRRDWRGARSVSIIGPGEMSFEQAAFTMERVLNRTVDYEEVSSDIYMREVVRSGASIHYARSMIEMFKAWDLDLPREQTRIAQLIGPTSLANWTKRELLPLMDGFDPAVWPQPIHVDVMEPSIA